MGSEATEDEDVPVVWTVAGVSVVSVVIDGIVGCAVVGYVGIHEDEDGFAAVAGDVGPEEIALVGLAGYAELVGLAETFVVGIDDAVSAVIESAAVFVAVASGPTENGASAGFGLWPEVVAVACMATLSVEFAGAVHVVTESDAAVLAGIGLDVIGSDAAVFVVIEFDAVLVVESGPVEYGVVLGVTVFGVVDSDAVFAAPGSVVGPGIETDHLV